MARARLRAATEAPLPQGAAAGRRAPLTQAATHLAQLLRARSFAVEGEAPSVQRLRANVQAGPGELLSDAAVWIGTGAPPADRLSVSLGEYAGTLGPNSFGFLNNLDGIAPLAAPMAERPRRGSIALIVPRRDALPEVVPLLCGHSLGISWLISVGDGDPSEALRFLTLDPATTGVLLALGRGARAQTLLGAAPDKPLVVLEPPGLRDAVLVRAAARRLGARWVGDLEEWLAHGALLESGVPPTNTEAPPRTASRRSPRNKARAAVLVLGAGADLVASEALRLGLPAPVRVDPDDSEAVAAALQAAARAAEVLVLCGAPELLPAGPAGLPTVKADPAQPQALRAVLQAVASPARQPGDERLIHAAADAGRVESVLADLPPPLYIGAEAVSDEALSDQDTKRLLHAYGVRVTRQAPASTVTAALRIFGKLDGPTLIVPGLGPLPDTAALAAAEAREAAVCDTQAAVKRHTSSLLARHAYVILREALPASPRARIVVGPERGLGAVLRMAPSSLPGASSGEERWEAALVPMQQGEARELAAQLACAHGCDAAGLERLLGQVASCASEHALQLDLTLHPADEPTVTLATGVLKRAATK
ncbi:MAG: hypothetical protein U1A78_09435 [Polyangia bacterium]